MLHPPVLSFEKLCVSFPPKCIYPRQRNIAIREMVQQSHMITTVSRSLTSTKMARLSIVVSFALEIDKDERNRLASMLTTMIEDGQSVMCDSKKLYEEAISQSLHLQRCSAFLRRK